MNCKIKKILSVILSVILLCFSSHIASALSTDEVLYNFEYPVLYPHSGLEYPDLMKSAGPNVETLENYVDIDTLREHLIENFATCPSYVIVEGFKIPASSWNSLKSFIWYETPELFHVKGLGYATSGGYIVDIYASYHYTASEYQVKFMEFTTGANTLLEGIKGNNNLDDIEKALLLHDRLAVWCEYDYENLLNQTLPQESYSAYGVFSRQIAVCMGYALAYDYLLHQVGIDSYYCSSKALNHAWNIVIIDDNEYHVDVTWDDPVYDRSGHVKHTNFLRSTTGIKSTGHVSNGTIDYYSTPTDTTYDSYFWQNSNTAFQLVGDDIYYIDQSEKTLNKISNGVTTTCKDVNAMWMASSSSCWPRHYGALSTDGKDLLYSLNTAIYKYDVSTGESQIIFEPDLTAGDYYYIYGFKYENCQLICEVFNTPNFTAGTKAQNTQTQVYHASSDWIVTQGSSATTQGIKKKTCTNCGEILATATLPLVSLSINSVASADYSACVIFTDVSTCDEITDLISTSGSTTMSAKPSYTVKSLNLYGTGSSVAIYNNSEHIYYMTIIVNGDLNGDSVCDVLDVAQTEKYSNNKGTATTNEIYAANGSVSDTIDAQTYQQVVNKALG